MRKTKKCSSTTPRPIDRTQSINKLQHRWLVASFRKFGPNSHGAAAQSLSFYAAKETSSLLYSSRILALLISDNLLEALARRVIAISTASPICSMETWGFGSLTASRRWLRGPISSRRSLCSVYREQSIDLQDLEHSDPINASIKGALVRSFCGKVYLLHRLRLSTPVIFLVKALSRNWLVWLVTGTTVMRALSFVGAHLTRGLLCPSPRPMKRSGHCWQCSWVEHHCPRVIV